MDDSRKKEGEKSDRDKSPEHTSRSPATGTTTVDSGDVDLVASEQVSAFLGAVGAYISRLPGESSQSKDFYSDLLRGLIKNTFDGLHGGMVGMLAERVAMACAMTVVAKDKALLLSELSLSYLSSATVHEELIVEAAVAKTGRNVTVITVEIRRNQNGKLLYLSHATFFHGSPTPKL